MENLNNTDKTSENAQKELRISDVIQRFIEKEKSQIQEKRLYYLKQKGDFSFHNLNSLQGQLGLLDRLEKEIKNVV
jgi:hypothetical protein